MTTTEKTSVMIGPNDRYASVVVGEICLRLRGINGCAAEILRWMGGYYEDLGTGTIRDDALVTEVELPSIVLGHLPQVLRLALHAPRCPACASPGPHCASIGTFVGNQGVPVCRVCARVFPRTPMAAPVEIVAVERAVSMALDRMPEHEMLQRYRGAAAWGAHETMLRAASAIEPGWLHEAVSAAAWGMGARTTDVDYEKRDRRTKAHEHAKRAIAMLEQLPSTTA